MTSPSFQPGITGRHQIVEAFPAHNHRRFILAAGTVLWRTDADGNIEFACIHRPRYDDWSLAKGKLDPGETLPTTAAREAKEETGYDICLGKLLGRVTYPVSGRTKLVFYWLAEVVGGEFIANSEVDEIRWVSPETAREMMSYEVDKLVIDKAIKRLKTPVTARILLVRHAKAHNRLSWTGDDNRRPLERKGHKQADLLPPMLLPYLPTAVYSAEPLRCVQTAKPLAKALGVEITIDRSFGDDGWIESMKTSQALIQKLIDTGGTSVVVSQGLMIPDLVAWLSARGTLPIPEFPAKKASVWVLNFTDGLLTGADYLESPLPIKMR